MPDIHAAAKTDTVNNELIFDEKWNSYNWKEIVLRITNFITLKSEEIANDK